jgi:glycosyltransferase involved in cell wall biosynthesis
MRQYFMTTTVSVIIPTFNRAHLINRAIQSVLSQTYRDFELIIIDDASNDGTEETAKKIISSNKSFHDPQIIYIKNRVRKGGSAARNIGIKLAKGKYIAFLDDDDEWLPTKLSEQVNIMNRSNENVGAVYAGFMWMMLPRQLFWH